MSDERRPIFPLAEFSRDATAERFSEALRYRVAAKLGAISTVTIETSVLPI